MSVFLKFEHVLMCFIVFRRLSLGAPTRSLTLGFIRIGLVINNTIDNNNNHNNDTIYS